MSYAHLKRFKTPVQAFISHLSCLCNSKHPTMATKPPKHSTKARRYHLYLLDEHNRTMICLVPANIVVDNSKQNDSAEDDRRPIELGRRRGGVDGPEGPELHQQSASLIPKTLLLRRIHKTPSTPHNRKRINRNAPSSQHECALWQSFGVHYSSPQDGADGEHVAL